jgi:hypothetical protein
MLALFDKDRRRASLLLPSRCLSGKSLPDISDNPFQDPDFFTNVDTKTDTK